MELRRHDAKIALAAGLICLGLLGAGCQTDSASAPTPPGAQAQWMTASTLQVGPKQSRKLSDDQLSRIQAVQQTFQDVDPNPLESWIDDFQHDQNPEREIRVYEDMAEAYRTFCNGRSLPPEAKRDVYQLVLLRSQAPTDEVLARMRLKVLSEAEAKEVLRGYTMPPLPLIVAPSRPPAPSPK